MAMTMDEHNTLTPALDAAHLAALRARLEVRAVSVLLDKGERGVSDLLPPMVDGERMPAVR